MLLGASATDAQLEAIADKLLHGLREPILFQGQQLEQDCSIGIAAYPEHAASAVELLAAADQAMYEAKTAGRNTLRAPSPGRRADPCPGAPFVAAGSSRAAGRRSRLHHANQRRVSPGQPAQPGHPPVGAGKPAGVCLRHPPVAQRPGPRRAGGQPCPEREMSMPS